MCIHLLSVRLSPRYTYNQYTEKHAIYIYIQHATAATDITSTANVDEFQKSVPTLFV